VFFAKTLFEGIKNIKTQSNSLLLLTIQAQVKQEILDQFQNLLKYEIIAHRFQFSVDGNHFISEESIQLEDIRSSKVIRFYEIINPI